MSNVILWGAVYDTDYVDLPKQGGGTVRFSEGGGSGGLQTENIISSQSINCSISLGDGAYGGFINTYSDKPVNGDYYLVTFDNTEYICRCHYRTSSILVVGDYYVTANTQYIEFPFAIIQNSTLFYLAVQGSGTHTIKVDKILSW